MIFASRSQLLNQNQGRIYKFNSHTDQYIIMIGCSSACDARRTTEGEDDDDGGQRDYEAAEKKKREKILGRCRTTIEENLIFSIKL